jgi:hypothetical protein
MGQIPIGMELIISCDFLIPNSMKLFQGSIWIGTKVINTWGVTTTM